MSQNPTPSLMESIQAEVSNEASPFLQALIKNARFIALGLGALIVAIVIAGGYRFYSSQQTADAREELGEIIMMESAADRMTRLEEYLVEAKPGFRVAALLALAQSADEVKDYDKAAGAWGKAAELADDGFRLVARMGQAGALVQQGKSEDAIGVLEAILPAANAMEAALINNRISYLAESIGNYDRAIRACDDMLNAQSTAQSKDALQQRRAYLVGRKAAASR